MAKPGTAEKGQLPSQALFVRPNDQFTEAELGVEHRGGFIVIQGELHGKNRDCEQRVRNQLRALRALHPQCFRRPGIDHDDFDVSALQHFGRSVVEPTVRDEGVHPRQLAERMSCGG